MILVTGATGHLGSATIDFLLQRVPASEIVAFVRDEAKAASLKAKGVALRVGDYHDYASLVRAFQGIDQLLFVSTGDLNDREGQQRNVVNAAKEAGVGHVVYTSASLEDRAEATITPFMHVHRYTEQLLRESGLTYTLAQDNLYADTLPDFVGRQVVETGIFFPAGEGRVPYATRRDMAEALAVILTTPGHANQTYQLDAGHSYSFADIAGFLTELAGKPVAYTHVPTEAFAAQLRQVGVPEGIIGFLLPFADAIRDGQFDQPTPTLEKLLGRKPTHLKEYLREAYFGG